MSAGNVLHDNERDGKLASNACAIPRNEFERNYFTFKAFLSYSLIKVCDVRLFGDFRMKGGRNVPGKVPLKWLSQLRILVGAVLLTGFVYASAEPQFRTEQNRERYDYPYNRPSTSRPRNANPNEDDPYRNPSLQDRYRGYQYRLNQRGGPEFGSRDRDRTRLNYNHQQQNENNYEDIELRNTIYDRWRPDLQGEERPGVTPGVNYPLSENVLVSTDTGKVQGFYVYLYDRPGIRPEEWPITKPIDLQRPYMNVSVFLGIPYAQPPYNEGRFKPPRRVRNWHTTWQAIDYSPACPQNLKYVGATMGIRSGIDEDCLYLNVFTPSLSVNARERYPVMFYIHGGDFDHGSGSQFPAHMLSAWGGVVVVTINYRLGALGFLSTGDYHSPGNYGLMDMALALEWVSNNIRFFNGDRERITVFGPGAGGAAAGLLAVIPKTRDWVSQVIAESGSPLAEWAAIDDPYRVQNTSRVFGLEMGCNVDNSYNLMHCLVNRDFEELATAPIKPDIGTFAWSPVVDGNFTVPEDSWYVDWSEKDFHILPELPLKLYNENRHHPLLRYLTGVNRDEAANFVFNDIRLSQNNFEVTEEFFNDRIREWVLHYNYTLNPQGAYDAIKWMYTFWPDPHNTTHIREQYIAFLSDALYKSGVDNIVKVLLNSTMKRSVPTYYYVLNTTVEALKLPLWREVPNDLEYYFISGAPFMDPDFYPETVRVSRHMWTEGDRNMSQFMMKTFANFARWGNPTISQVEPVQINWEITEENAFKYLCINNTFNTTMHYNYRQLENTFWYQYMPLVVREYIPLAVPPRNPWLDMKEPVTATMYGLLFVVVGFFVVLCVCCGLWKSAKKQRNKALDDLSYYSTENLTLAKDEDYEVRNYLEKLNAVRQNAPSRTGTINTMLTGDVTTNTLTRPITPSMNAKNSYQATITEPDHQYVPALQNLKKPSFEKPLIMELEEPSRVIRGHHVTPATRNFDSSTPATKQFDSSTLKAGHEPEHIDNSNVNTEYLVDPLLLANGVGIPVSSDLPEYPESKNQFVPPSNEPMTVYSKTYDHPLVSATTHQPYQNGVYHGPTEVPNEQQLDNANVIYQRPVTPSALTFEISMKPSKSVGTISTASGLILNTDL